MVPTEPGLTLTEARVARLVADGRTNQEVSASLAIPPKSVQGHLGRVYRKLGVRSRTELALLLATAAAERPVAETERPAQPREERNE